MEAGSTRSTVNSIIRVVIATGAVLLAPFLAMQFSDEVDWDLTDFVIIGALVMSTGLIYEFIAKKVTNRVHRTALALGLAAVSVLIWIELAVGVLGTPFAGS